MEAGDYLKMFHHQLRLDILLRGPGSRILRQCFRQRYLRLKGQKWEDGLPRNKQFFVDETKPTKWMGLQQERIEKANLDEFDITLLTQVLKIIKWGPETPNLASENEQIQKLVIARNVIAHSSREGTILSEESFNELWASCRGALLELDSGDGSEPATSRKNLEMEIEIIRLQKNLEGLEFGTAEPSGKYMEEAKELRKKGDEFLDDDRHEEALQCYLEALDLPGLSSEELRRLYSSTGQVRLKMLMEQFTGSLHPRARGMMKEMQRNIKENPKWKEENFQDPQTVPFLQIAEELLMNEAEDLPDSTTELLSKIVKGLFKDVLDAGKDIIFEDGFDGANFKSKLVEKLGNKTADNGDSNAFSSLLATLLSSDTERPQGQKLKNPLEDLLKAVGVMFMGDKFGKDEGFFQDIARSVVKDEKEILEQAGDPGSSSPQNLTPGPSNSSTKAESSTPSSSNTPSTSSQGNNDVGNVMKMLLGNNKELLKNGAQIVRHLSKVMCEKIDPLVERLEQNMNEAKDNLDKLSINDDMDLD